MWRVELDNLERFQDQTQATLPLHFRLIDQVGFLRLVVKEKRKVSLDNPKLPIPFNLNKFWMGLSNFFQEYFYIRDCDKNYDLKCFLF
jgi:hypothetical protein